MRFLVTVKMPEDVGEAPAALQEAMGRGMQEMFASGEMVDAGGLFPLALSTEIRVAGGRLTVTDGPYAEAKEVAGGYAILRVDSPEQALARAREVAELHQNFWPGWAGSIEVRRIAEPAEAPPAAS